MNEMEFYKYVLAECERQWHENQEEIYGPWHEQSDDTIAEYYNDMYKHLKFRNDYYDDECPLGGDATDDCADCVYSCDYHCVNGECVKREEK